MTQKSGYRSAMRNSLLPAAALIALAATPALAAGYGLKEHSADAMAAAYAGAAASDHDASYLAYNPAASGGVAGTDMSASLVAILPGSSANYSTALTSAGTPAGGGAKPSGFISDALVPAFAARTRLNDKLTLGLSISAPWGLRTDYSAQWAGRYYALKSSLLTINATPSLAYRVIPELTLGAGVQIEYGQGTLSSAIDTGTLGALNGIPGSIPGAQDSTARLSGHNWTFGYVLGAIYKPAADLAIGISYRSSLQHDLKGPLTFNLSGTGAIINAVTGLFANTRQTTPLTMPDMVDAGLRKDFSDDWSGMLEFDWTHWSRFRALTVIAANPLQPSDVTTTRWNDAVFGSAGVEYRASRTWTWRAGVAYDQSPTADATREPRIPDADRIWISGGARIRLSDAFDLNVTASRLFNLKTKIALDPTLPGGALRGTLAGTTQSYVNCVGLEISWRAD